MHKIGIFIIFSLLAILLSVSVFLWDQNYTPPPKTSMATCHLELRGDVAVEMASTPEAHERGLSGHPPLREGEGMLFSFATSEERSFWMKDMLFPIDIIWLDKSFRVLSFYEDVRPESFPASYVSPSAMRYALEVPSGTVARRGILTGDIARIDSKCAN